MAWLTIEKKGQEVRFMDGTPFVLGERVYLGRSFVELRPYNGRGVSVARYKNETDLGYVTPLNRDGKYRVGDDHCFRLVEAREERDPVICALRLVGVSPNMLRQLDGDDELSVSLFECDLEKAECGTSTVGLITDGRVRELGEGASDGPRKNVLVSPGTYAIEVVARKLATGAIRSNPEKVTVWPGCSGRELTLALARSQVGDDAKTDGYYEALSSAEAAKDWIRRRFAMVPHPADGDKLLADGREFSLERNDALPASLERLKSLHGWGILQEWFGAQQMAYLAAKRDVSLAAKFMAERYAVSGLRRGDDRFVKLSRLDDPQNQYVLTVGKLPPFDAPYQALFARHWELSERLFLASQDRQDLVAFYPICQEFELRHHHWYAKCHWSRTARHDEWRPVANRSDATEAWLRNADFCSALTDLTASQAADSNDSMPDSIYACLRVGDEAYATNDGALFIIKNNETRDYVFLIKMMCGSKRVMGVRVTRTEDGLAFLPYPTGDRYAVTGARSIDVVAA